VITDVATTDILQLPMISASHYTALIVPYLSCLAPPVTFTSRRRSTLHHYHTHAMSHQTVLCDM